MPRREKSVGEIFSNGLFKQNPVFVQFLGMCPTLAVTGSVDNALGMGAGVTFVLVLSNTAISLLRTRASEKKRITQASCDNVPQSTPDHEISQKQLVDTLRAYVAQLPKHLQDVVALRDLAELPYSQVARVLGITPGTARVYRCKAVTLLAAWMNKKDE